MEQKKIGKNIKDERIKKGFSCRHLAKRLQLSHTTITRWEKGETCINSVDLISVCRVLDIPIKNIVGVL